MGFQGKNTLEKFITSSSGNNPDPGSKPTSVALAGGFSLLKPPGKLCALPNLYKRQRFGNFAFIVTLYPSIATNKWMPTGDQFKPEW